jgi:hypothetical protein
MKKISLSEIRRTVREVIRENEEQDSGDEKLRIRKLEDRLTMDMLKSRYPWVLEANIENAVIGLDNDGIVWYNGIWHDGAWKDGKWLKGTFAGGTWGRGEFYGGTFTGETWKSGEFWRGTFNGRTWEGGNFYGGTFAGQTWEIGWFHGGTFAGGIWKDGRWYQDGQNWWTKHPTSGTLYKEDNIIWESGKWKGGTIFYNEGDRLVERESFVNPNEFFKGDDEAEYNIEQDGNYFIVTYKDYKGQENEKIFRSKEAAENFAKNL